MSKVITLKLGFSDAFLVKEQGTIIVDTGINVRREKYLELFRLFNIEPKEVGLIIISHGHADHYGNVHLLKEITGAPVLCHRNAVGAVQAGRDAKVVPRNKLGEDVFKLIKNHLPKAFNFIAPDIIMDDFFDLTPFGVNGKIIHTPGHSDCSVSVILNSGEAIVGDIMVQSFFTAEPCLAYFATNEDALFSSFRRLLLEANTFYGGHGGPFTKDEASKMH